MHDSKSQDLLLATLAADSYCLGTHWVYDIEELKKLDINYKELNKPHAPWHKGKTKGDFTHYGDQIVILDNFLKDKINFSVEEYMSYWRDKMNSFQGYVDGSTKDTIANIDNNLAIPCGSNSGDMSIIGKIAPLLRVSSSKKEFMKNTRLFAQATHNNEDVLEAMNFFSTLLLKVLDGGNIKESILKLKNNYSQNAQNFIDEGIKSKDEDTVSAISRFGSPCSTKFCFPSTIHLLFKYDNYEEALIQNAKAGGDSSARAMVVAYIFVAKDSIDIVPKQWLEFNAML